MDIPAEILKQLYTFGSLKNTSKGIAFNLKNPLMDATVTKVCLLEINGKNIGLDRISIQKYDKIIPAGEINKETCLPFPTQENVDIFVSTDSLPPGEHTLRFKFTTEPFGEIDFTVNDFIGNGRFKLTAVPCNKADNYSSDIIRERREFLHRFTGVKPDHITHHSFDPVVTKGNIENFTGVAQVPLGFAGPIKVNGEYAKGEFVIPLATSEGSLVASYNRGMKAINLSGGVTTTIVGDHMHRAPVFEFDNSREAKKFSLWIDENFLKIKTQAESTSRVAKLLSIDKFITARFVYTRFNYSTGDAAGQNMVSMATFAACNWIIANFPGIRHYFMESNISSDKKFSQINLTHPRGKRVIAEIWIKREVMLNTMRTSPESLAHLMLLGNLGSQQAGSFTCLHVANALAALFIATGQDAANVAESSAGMVYAEVTPEGDLYGALTLPSLIVATYGGGTGLPTQRECLEMMGCYGPGKVNKFTEIVAAVATAGELSLASAISSLDWVYSHERMGKNR